MTTAAETSLETQPAATGHRLSGRSLLAVLLFAGSLLLIHLGDTRVLTRHEVLAAQPAREMLAYPQSTRWILPTFAGVYRTAKPPGMMWLIAASMAALHSQSELAARLPSALAAVWLSVLMAILVARWFGDFPGLLAGLLQSTWFYTLVQARLAEADMALCAAVATAMAAMLVATVDSPRGRSNLLVSSTLFGAATALAFMLKGPVGPAFVLSAAILFALVRREKRAWLFLANPLAWVLILGVPIAWRLACLHLYPGITKDWHAEVVGTAAGTWGRDPVVAYAWLVPLDLLPWLPFVIIGLVDGIKRGYLRKPLGQFLACWFVPGIVILSAMAKKEKHYVMPILPPFTFAAACGLVIYLREQYRKTNPRHALVAAIWVAGCAIAIGLVLVLKKVPGPYKPTLGGLILVLAVGGAVTIYFEHRRTRAGQLAGYFATAWLVAVGVQTFLMPVQDDYRYQADFARAANALVPPGDVIHLIGHREEEHEAQYAYYLRFPMRRYDAFEEFVNRKTAGDVTYAIGPRGIEPDLRRLGNLTPLTASAGLRLHETDADRPTLYRIERQRDFGRRSTQMNANQRREDE